MEWNECLSRLRTIRSSSELEVASWTLKSSLSSIATQLTGQRTVQVVWRDSLAIYQPYLLSRVAVRKTWKEPLNKQHLHMSEDLTVVWETKNSGLSIALNSSQFKPKLPLIRIHTPRKREEHLLVQMEDKIRKIQTFHCNNNINKIQLYWRNSRYLMKWRILCKYHQRFATLMLLPLNMTDC